MSDPLLFVLGSALMAAVEAGSYAEALPERRYVSDGDVAWDFDAHGEVILWGSQVTVQVGRAYPHAGDPMLETPMHLSAVTGMACSAEIQILRCAPTVEEDEGGFSVPSPAEIEASAAVVQADKLDVLAALLAAYRAGDLPGCSGVVYLGVTGVGPAGGLAGSTTTVVLDLAG